MIFDTLAQAIGQKKNPTCVGLDTQKTHVPEEIAQRYDMHTQAGAADAIVAYNAALIEALRNGMGVSILPRRLLIPYLNAHELCEITLKDQPLNREWYLIHHSRKALTAPMQEFIRFLQQTTW